MRLPPVTGTVLERLATLQGTREALQRELEAAAEHTEKRRLRGLLTSTERALRWQRSRAGLTSTPDPGITPG